ncbi:MAG: long-chain fatty acid--CoA ligase [Desulfobacteraceae bacterium]|nr:MAG: long-chain fatty acid--CoA ligase [Desulfobacteraceae bacterium]
MNNLRSLTLFDIYEQHANHSGQLTAIHANGHDTSYADLFEHTCRLINGLGALNLKPGSRIGVLSANHPAFFHLFGAASALGLSLVLINRRLSYEEISGIVEDTTPQILISDSGLADTAEKLAGRFEFLNQCFVIDPENTTSQNYDDFSTLYKNDASNPVPTGSGDDPFIIIHTAAVQGKPRGAILSQENAILASMQAAWTFGMDSSWAHLNILPLFHIMGVNLGLGTLLAKGKNVILEKFDPNLTLDLIQSQDISIIGSFPPILNTLMEAAQDGRFDLSSLKVAAGIETPEVVEKWESMTSSKFWTMYGQTETSGLITFSEYFAKPGSAGKLSMLANIEIVDDFDNALPSGSTGEIVVRGPLVFQGYWNADDLNAHTFREGWHHTGDLGMIDTDGFLFFKGRKAEKELIKPGGENVFPAEVEKVILAHSAIKDVCVFGVPDPKFGEGIKAVCSLNEGQALTAEALVAFTASKIAGYKKPRYVEFISELPKADDGSIDRQAVKQQYSN